jgi:protein-tyrosine phosphatase
MFFFKKKKDVKEKVNFDIGNYIEVDIHSHLLPGIDDGAENVEKSTELITGLTVGGIRKIITTPHVMADIHKNTPTTIANAYNELKPTLNKYFSSLPFNYAAEYLLDELFIEKLKNNEILPLFDNYILVETPFLYEPLNLEQFIFEIQAAGLIPIMAHPERYLYMFNKQDWFFKLKKLGCLLQMNLLSLTGYYGKMEKDMAKYLLENEMYDYFGSDMHHGRHLKRFQDYQIDKEIAVLLDKNYKNIKNRNLL